MARDPEILAHQEWLGFVQPIGLVVSIPALLAAEAYVNRNIAPIHQKFLSCLRRDVLDEPLAEVSDFADFARNVLDWEPSDLIRLPEDSLPPEFAELEVALPEYGERLRPTFVIPELKAKEGQSRWIMLVQVLTKGTSLDDASANDKHGWQASPQAKFERLLRETEVSIGLIVTDTHLRLVYAPRGETSGYITFSVSNMMQVAGRPILAGLHMLLSNDRLFVMDDKHRLPAILAESRKYQNTVSTKLAEQVLAALYELLRGFQAANEQRHGDLLRDILKNSPDHIYAGLLSVLMRLVFVLYAEDRGLLSNSSIYTSFYSVSGLFERLREDKGHYPDTMDHRFGAWAQLLTLFRLIFDGGSHGELNIPARKGHLFDPDRYPFLEGRTTTSEQDIAMGLSIPHVSDGVIYRILSNLLILDAERLSYRTLDVEQIGSVYEAIMGFGLDQAQGPSIAIRAKTQHGAPRCIDLEELLTTKQIERPKWLKDHADQELAGPALAALKDATTIGDLLIALEKKIASLATPHVVPRGNMLLQPSDERRRSGSHYTPRLLTAPIVSTTLKPILDRLGSDRSPEQILGLKICDPAMGSGAFLVEACRQLGEELVRAWHRTNSLPPIPPDEDELLHARRLVAQRCLYGVDRNPMAVDLAKLSLWLATLAKDHPFTFLDHTLRCGDSLVGLTREQIIRFHWQPTAQRAIDEKRIKGCIEKATSYRRDILENAENTFYPMLQIKLSEADKALEVVRQIGNAVLSAFFTSDNERQREHARFELLPKVAAMLSQAKEHSASVSRADSLLETPSYNVNPVADAAMLLRLASHPILPFHWEIEFPEVFERGNGGFDVVVGNPPFLGGKRISTMLGDGFRDWLAVVHEETNSSADLVAHFFRRAYNLLRDGGTLGLVATNTVGQGDTRHTGLRWICTNGGSIYSATRRMQWPGQAAVVVSIIHISRAVAVDRCRLDGRDVPVITSYLFHKGNDDEPKKLHANKGRSYIGCFVLGMGFTFDDSDRTGDALPISAMTELIERNPKNASRIQPYIGGADVCDSPTHAYRRYVINFGDMSLEEAENWPDLIKIVRERVKPQRDKLKRAAYRDRWWQFGEKQSALVRATEGLKRALVCSRISNAFAFTFIPAGIVLNEKLVVFPFESYSPFCIIQSRVHELWARFFSATLKDDLQYTPTDCFETFPLPDGFETDIHLEECGRNYFEFRAPLMIQNNEGLTKTYNRFHDPNQLTPEIVKLRELHMAMDQAVLQAYGWSDLRPDTEFLLSYGDDEEDEEDKSRSSGGARKRPYRYRWTDEYHDEVLARLLELNKQRVEEERILGLSVQGAQANPVKSKGKQTGKSFTKTQTGIERDDQRGQLSILKIES